MNNHMEELMGQLEVAESLEQMVSIEDEIAAMIGKGFLDGEFDYTFLMRTKEQVEQREKTCRELFERKDMVQEKDRHAPDRIWRSYMLWNRRYIREKKEISMHI